MSRDPLIRQKMQQMRTIFAAREEKMVNNLLNIGEKT